MVHHRPGVTFVELLIVVLILAVVAATAIPRYAASLQHFRLEAAARRIVADLELARRTARSTGRECLVRFDVPANEYTVVDVQDLDRRTTDATTRLAETGYSATLVSVDFNASDRVTFDPHGCPKAGSPPARLTTGAVVIQASHGQRTILVDPTTGKAHIQ